MKKILGVFFLAHSLDVFASSFITIRSRCNESNLGSDEAHGRNFWAKKCFSMFNSEIDNNDKMNPVHYALVSDQEEKRWDAPIREKDDCGIWSKMQAFCVASCYTPTQKIKFDEKEISIIKAFDHLEAKVTTLTKSSSLNRLDYQVLAVDSYTRSWRDGLEKIREIKTRSGGSLQVTMGHPLLKASGIMVQAKDLILGDSLVKEDGTFDEISYIKDIDYFGKVYNLDPKSHHPIENILVAQGFLVGSANYQYNQLFRSHWYRKILRSLRHIEDDTIKENL